MNDNILPWHLYSTLLLYGCTVPFKRSALLKKTLRALYENKVPSSDDLSYKKYIVLLPAVVTTKRDLMFQ
jgi:hypothetical protein